MQRFLILLSTTSLLAACNRDRQPDAYGTFEANEVVVSTQAAGQLKSFTPTEGARLARGEVVGLVDTVQLALQREQVVAQREAIQSHVTEIGQQLNVLEVQRAIALRTYERTRRLFNERAATAQQLDQAERDYKVLVAQMGAVRAQQQSAAKETTSGDARVAQIAESLKRARIINPQTGTVLATFTRAGESVQPGQALYKIANLDSLTLRAYISEEQLHAIRLGSTVQVHVDSGNGKMISLPGRVQWIASKAEFTPTPVQTRDERADLVYGVKIAVANRDGGLKIGMPADVDLPPAQPRT
ncbi:MAG TPA: HlyD family efflux transporter periplasmic adaptor subunit [Gemmatimonadaceae bacterium]|nr:HlyD family efflux transporter periplasmic adaptor subunit [Gemmatimonadaceae bacterium]